MNIHEYFKDIEEKVRISYVVAEGARVKGLDPKSKVEVPIATSLAARVAGLVSVVYPQLNNPQLVNRILELEKEYGNLDPAVCLKIAEEVAKEKLCKFNSLLEAIDAGIRVAMAYTTLSVVSSPIEGFTELKLKKTQDGKEYFAPYFSGPIRSAGGTAAAFTLVVIDYLREILGYAPFDPTEEEVKRAVTEIYDYHERVTNLQYLPSEKEVEFLARYIPVQIDGDPSEDKEVSNFKDLSRIETNFIRGGFCLVLAEGLAQKAPKILKMVKKLREKGFKMTNWDYLEKFVELQNKIKEEKKKVKESATYIKDIVAGRPVLGHPSKSGAFRLRYGRARTTGYSCLAIHPASMGILDNFIAIGSQLKIELPTKGASIASCDSIEGPIVKLKNGAVRKIKDLEEANRIYDSISEVIYLGDMLVPYGDFANRNHLLMPAGYCEQEWFHDFRRKKSSHEDFLDVHNIYEVNFEEAIYISKKFEIPLHPRYIFYWSQIDYSEFKALLDWISNLKFDKRIILPWNSIEQERFKKAKRALELIGVPHEISIENVLLNSEDSKAILMNLGIELTEVFDIKKKIDLINEILLDKENEKVLNLVNIISKFKIKDKAGTFIGSRMGRPEKAKLRKLTGSPNVLFPVGEEGGRLRSVNEAYSGGFVKSDFPIYFCKNCNKETIYFKCDSCGSETSKMYYCPECKEKITTEKCPGHLKGVEYYERKVNLKDIFDNSIKKLDLLPNEIPNIIKGVKGTSNKAHVPENLAKGFLRALFNLQVNKDGTIRFDATEMPITHFKPGEIGAKVERLRELGYEKDIHGRELENEEQILEIFPHDIILPCCPESPDEKADDVFFRVCNFVDSELVRLYGMKSFYNLKTKEDLIGHLVSCMAPHNCASVVGRIIGFSKTQALLASPYMHAAMRRDCDGDEAAVMLLLDMLINFSREYLPAHRGGTQDAPLVLNIRMRAGEVDDMIFDFDIVRELPFEIYEEGNKKSHPSVVKVSQIKQRVGNNEFRDLWYEYEVSDINNGVLCSNYKKLDSMQEKVQREMELCVKIRAVNESDVARLIIDRHLIRDIRGNLRKFSQQEFRCSKCNLKYRRPLLTGRCTCGGNIIFTISEGSIIKYLEPALALANKYDVPPYIKQSIELTKSYIESIFGKEKEKQIELKNWFK